MTTGQAARPTRQAPLYGGLLVGGASRRMGRPKALLATAGGTLAERAAAALRPAVERLVLLGDGPVPPLLAGLPRLADAVLPGAADGPAGPLAGLLAALRWAPEAAWVLCPCDLPAVRPAAVRWLASQRRPERLAVLPRAVPDGPPEPLLALYEPGVRPAVEALAAAGGRAPRRLADAAGVAVVEVPPELADCWRDADTPDELAAAGMPTASS
jgi:molybdopterin-guanine dinucleotide biosynthesis protein A